MLRPQNSPDDAILNDHLQPLCGFGGEFAPLLHGGEIFGSNAAGEQLAAKKIRSCNCILNRQVDSDAADGRHGMCRVADA